jgi:hypothetical protein
VDEVPNPNAPTPRQAARMRLPEARHRAARVDHHSKPHGHANTVAMPWVDFGADRAAILAGRASRSGNRFDVNGRTYMLEGGGRLYPLIGDGLVRLERGAYRALGLYNHGGMTVEVEEQLDLERVLEVERERAREVWRTLREWHEGRRDVLASTDG